MTPDAVYAFVSREYPELSAEPRRNPDGWSFFLGPKKGVQQPNRILRVVASSRNRPSRLKLAVTSRLKSETEFVFQGDETELKALIDRELELFKDL